MAQVDVLVAGYAQRDGRVGSTVILVRSGEVVAVVDPGMVADQRLILDPLVDLGIPLAAVTDVVLSHHHPEDPRATDLPLLYRNRARVLEVASTIVPGHGEPFEVTDDTPR